MPETGKQRFTGRAKELRIPGRAKTWTASHPEFSGDFSLKIEICKFTGMWKKCQEDAWIKSSNTEFQ